MKSSMRAFLAEVIGTFVLVFCGCGSAVFAGKEIGFLGIAIAFGLAVMVMVYAIGPISGCHINPAVTIALWITRRFRGSLIGYIVAQLIGGVLGAAVLLMIAHGAPGHDPIGGFATTGYGAPDHYSLGAGFLAEVVLTALLIFTIFGVTDVKASPGFAGIAIGLYVTMALLVGIPVTGCSMNPARSFAVAVFAGGEALHQLWMFIVAPILGGIVGAGIYEMIRDRVPPITEKTAVRATSSEEADRYATEVRDASAGGNGQ